MRHKVLKVSTRNAAFQKFEVLKTNRRKRYQYGEFFVEGVRNLKEAVKNSWNVVSLLYTRERPLSGWAEEMLENTKTEVNYELSLELMEELSGKEDTSELMAVVQMREDRISQITHADPAAPLLALFDRPSNHGNLGTVLRSCDAFGIDGLIITGHAVDLYDPNVIVSSMGSFFKVPAVRVPESQRVLAYLQEMKEQYPGFQVVGTTAHHETPLDQVNFQLPTLLLIGNETDGLCRLLKETSDVLATIPMSETASASSFNVACAATVMFYEAVRQRKG